MDQGWSGSLLSCAKLRTDLIEMQCVIVPNKYSCAITNSGNHCWSRRKLNRTDGAQQQKKTATIAANFYFIYFLNLMSTFRQINNFASKIFAQLPFF
jgi:hypothetical protein